MSLLSMAGMANISGESNPIKALFSQGQRGLWLDPSDFSTMFQDVGGTIPVTEVGQIVRRINDKSGNENHFFAASGDVHLQSNNGMKYLSFMAASMESYPASQALSLRTNSVYMVHAQHAHSRFSGFASRGPPQSGFAGQSGDYYISPNSSTFVYYRNGSNQFETTIPPVDRQIPQVFSVQLDRSIGECSTKYNGLYGPLSVFTPDANIDLNNNKSPTIYYSNAIYGSRTDMYGMVLVLDFNIPSEQSRVEAENWLADKMGL